MQSDVGNLKLQVGTLGHSLKTALKPNTDVLNELHYCIARCNGETHTTMLDLPFEHSLPHESHTPPCLASNKTALLECWTNPPALFSPVLLQQ